MGMIENVDHSVSPSATTAAIPFGKHRPSPSPSNSSRIVGGGSGGGGSITLGSDSSPRSRLLSEGSSSSTPANSPRRFPSLNHVASSHSSSASINSLLAEPSSAGGLDGPSKKYIIYLEPRRDSSLFQSIQRFFVASKDVMFHNEAHMYDPHTSLTGFFELPADVDGLDFDVVLAERLDLAIRTFISHLSVGPQLSGLFVSSNSKGNSLQISIVTPSAYRDAIAVVKSDIHSLLADIYADQDSIPPTCRLRPKMMDHISLAYLKSFPNSTPGGEKLSSVHIRNLHEMARSMVSLEDPVEWYIVLYQVEFKSANITVPHEFRPLRKWKVFTKGGGGGFDDGPSQ